ncbi:MAG: HAD-IIIA family hydrolase [Phycisphaeraceae bacterium]
MNRAVFLDRDNTLIHNDGDLGDPALVRLIQGAASAVASLRGLGYQIIVVSNQAGVARGAFTEEDVEKTNNRVNELIRTNSGAWVDRFYYCPYHPEGTVEKYKRQHPWRKPQPGMLLQAAKDLKLDLGQCWMIGDQMRDVEAGAAAGVRTVLLSPQAGVQPPLRQERAAAELLTREVGSPLILPDFVAKNLVEAVRIVAQQRRPEGLDDVRKSEAPSPVSALKKGISTFLQGGAARPEGVGATQGAPAPVKPVTVPQPVPPAPVAAAAPDAVMAPAPTPAPPTDTPKTGIGTFVDAKPTPAPAGDAVPKKGISTFFAAPATEAVAKPSDSPAAVTSPDAEPAPLPEDRPPVFTPPARPAPLTADVGASSSAAHPDSPHQASGLMAPPVPPAVRPGTPAAAAPGVPATPSAEHTLRQILQELRNHRQISHEFSYMGVVAIVLQMIAVICFLGALWIGQSSDPTFFRWLGTALFLELSTLVLLLFIRRG